MATKMTKRTLPRRDFLASAGAIFLSGLTGQQAFSLNNSESVFASAAKTDDGYFVAALVSEQGRLISTVKLPGRGHDIVQCPITDRFVVFARRPGNFAIVFDRAGTHVSTIMTPAGRHFYGHGTFSSNGHLLYATENDFEAARGIIGVYDVTNSFKRVGEFYSGGVGPHDVMLTPGGQYLCVANGGVETHPDFGREKLNLTTMQSNICWIDVDTGGLVARHELPASLQKLSLRHLTQGVQNSFWVGGQYQGVQTDNAPLLARISMDEPIEFIELPENANQLMSGYIGSLAASQDKEKIALTSSRSDVAVVFDVTQGTVEITAQSNAGGAAWPTIGKKPIISTGNGYIGSGRTSMLKSEIFFDNHLRRVM